MVSIKAILNFMVVFVFTGKHVIFRK